MESVDWNQVIGHDPDVIGGMLRDVVKHGNRSRRKSLSLQERSRSLRQIHSEDVSSQPFHLALRALQGTAPLNEFSDEVGIPIEILTVLLSGEILPDDDLLIDISSSLNRPRDYFLEYRIHKVLFSIGSFLRKNPETLEVWFSRL